MRQWSMSGVPRTNAAGVGCAQSAGSAVSLFQIKQTKTCRVELAMAAA